ncbi:Gfo/Idh/MocA family protein [Rhodopirellula sallentina]|uniref:Oxidoreductase domain-containing protein n=1 Tax=Rhodopirellula sallentina SM41 TaxID=1263870 RepID=M5U952_9BACT|nr:Gfo/Idh/MocA family oxidoreductase [Rhodopirellula sallentina]EMI57799.1 oxidoreductase domain-containing protein [Rhodopirellula sallentina SM41]
MSKPQSSAHSDTHLPSAEGSNRRRFIQAGGVLAAGSVLPATAATSVHVGEDNMIRLALVGCGSRGTGAVVNAFGTSNQGPISLHATADLDPRNVELRLRSLKKKYADKVDVPPERQFIGFDAYKKAIDTLKPGDVALCTTRAYIRPVHVEYAVSRGINVFMEKPFATDPMGLHRMLRAGELAEQNGVKIAAGLQCRHSPARAALIERIREDAIGDISYVCANRLGGRRWMGDQRDKSNVLKEQLRFGKIGLLWVGSGHMVDFLIHQIDECCWLMDDWPVSCHGMGGREVGSTDRGQNMDTYSMEFTFANGKKAFCGFRRAQGGFNEFATFVHGTKKAAQFSGKVHKATVHMFKDQVVSDANIEWSPTPDAHSPWDYEWISFIKSIRNDLPHNEAKRAVYSDYASLMGRAACHLNRVVTRDEIVNSKFQFCDQLDEMTFDSAPPVVAGDEGYFPLPGARDWKET